METQFNNSVEHLIKHGYAQFEIPSLGTKLFQSIMNNQKSIFEIMEVKKDNMIFSTDLSSALDDLDRGFFKRHKGLGKDNKDCGHFRPTLKEELIQKLANEYKCSINEFPDLISYLYESEHVYVNASELALKILTAVDFKINTTLAKNFSNPLSLEINSLRTIGYKEPVKDTVVAGYHYDRDLITLAPYESAPGLMFESNGEMIPYIYEPGKCLVFWGEKADILTNGKLKKIAHGVDVLKAGVQRDSIVFFGHSHLPQITQSSPVPNKYRN